jgi:hypothetical protein
MTGLAELASVAAGYLNAVRFESSRRPPRIIEPLRQILVARLRYGIGPRNFSLFQLRDRPESDWDSYVVEFSSFKQTLASLSPPSVHAIADDKVLFHKFCRDHELPTIPIICVVESANEPNYSGVPRVVDIEGWRSALSNHRGGLFLKPADGVFGEGAFTIQESGGRYEFGGQTGSFDDAFRYVADRLGSVRAYVVQPQVKCHSTMAAITSHGLSTIRAVTCMSQGSAKLLYAILRITVGQNITDNFHYGSTGNLIAAIDLESGQLASGWGSLRSDWPMMTAFTHHPDTGNTIEGSVLAGWKETVSLVLRAQQALPELRATGWDVGITQDGPVLVETNPRFSFAGLQVAHGRGLKHEVARAVGMPGY